MSIYKFSESDIIRNVARSYPTQKFVIYDSYLHTSQVFPSSSMEMSSITYKDSNFDGPEGVSQTSYNLLQYGDAIVGSSYSIYSASLAITRYLTGLSASYENLCNNNSVYSTHYSYSTQDWNKGAQDCTVVSIPSAFYGSSIKKGTANLKFYFTGTMVAELKDIRSNGELIQVGPEGSNSSGSVAGVVFYEQGIILLTGSWDITEENVGASFGAWTDFGYGLNTTPASEGDYANFTSELEFKGVHKTPIITMFCHAPKGELNHSNNPTYVQHNQNPYPMTSSTEYIESAEILIKNNNDTNYLTPTSEFDKITYITKVNIYDVDKNIIGVAKLARPLKKAEKDEYTFKIKVDI